MKKIYLIEWYLEREQEYKRKLVSDRETAEQQYQLIKDALHNGCWIALSELEEKDPSSGFERIEEPIHYTEVWR